MDERNLESHLPISQTQPAFHRHAQRNAFRRRGVRRQQRCLPLELIVETQPKASRFR